jgi:hypothetical protein
MTSMVEKIILQPVDQPEPEWWFAIDHRSFVPEAATPRPASKKGQRQFSIAGGRRSAFFALAEEHHVE